MNHKKNNTPKKLCPSCCKSKMSAVDYFFDVASDRCHACGYIKIYRETDKNEPYQDWMKENPFEKFRLI